jgi:hypothetical protein
MRSESWTAFTRTKQPPRGAWSSAVEISTLRPGFVVEVGLDRSEQH